MNLQEYDNKNANYEKRMKALVVKRLTRPRDKFLHSKGRVERRDGIENYANARTIGIKGFNIIWQRFILSTMPFILLGMTKQHAVNLFDMIFS